MLAGPVNTELEVKGDPLIEYVYGEAPPEIEAVISPSETPKQLMSWPL